MPKPVSGERMLDQSKVDFSAYPKAEKKAEAPQHDKWEQRHSQQHGGSMYYVNKRTRQRQWERPSQAEWM